MQYYKYCPMCSIELIWEFIDGRKRLFCNNCQWIDYKNPVPVVACLVSNEKKEILLIKRAIHPCKGEWALPGGFVELYESIFDAGIRELFEETGLKSNYKKIVNIYVHDSKIYGSILEVGIELIVERFDFNLGKEVLDAKFFNKEAIPKIAFSTHKKLINNFFII